MFTLLKPSKPLSDLLLLLARVALGAVFLAHGLQKLLTFGMTAASQSFEGMGVPLPTVSAWAAMLIETVGGAALILGALTPLFAALLTLDMVGALLLVHLGNGIWVTDNGYELVLALGAGALAFVAAGAGAFSVDSIVAKRGAAGSTLADSPQAQRDTVSAGR